MSLQTLTAESAEHAAEHAAEYAAVPPVTPPDVEISFLPRVTSLHRGDYLSLKAEKMG